MISFSDVSKQYGRQVLFVDASFQLNPGEKVGLVGPNGAGKSTLFRMIMGEEHADEGDVSVPKKLSIGYFRQEVDEMAGRSVLDEAIAGSGRLGDLHHELEALEHAMADPDRADEMEAILDRFGDVQDEYQHRGGYELEARAREVLHGLGFEDEQIDGDVGALSGGWKMRVSMAKVLLGRPDVLLLDEPTNHLDIESILWLEDYLKAYPGDAADDLPRPGLHEPRRHEDRRDRRRRDRHLFGELRLLRAGAGPCANPARGRLRAPAGEARQGAALHRALLGPRRQGRPGAEPGQDAGEDRAIELPKRRRRRETSTSARRPAPATTSWRSRRCRRPTAGRTLYDGFDFLIRRGERWCVMGKNGAGKSTLLKMVAGVARARRAGRCSLGASLKLGYFAQQSLDLLDPELTVLEQMQKDFPAEGLGRPAEPAGRLPVLRRRRGQDDPVPLGRREVAPGHGADALRSAELPGARRADQPPGPRHEGDARRGRSGTSKARCSSSPTTGPSCAASRTGSSSSGEPGGPVGVRRVVRGVRGEVRATRRRASTSDKTSLSDSDPAQKEEI